MTEMTDYDQEKWVDLYQAAMLELEHSLMAGRLQDARPEILKRIEKLRDMPGLHREERQAVEDALSGLRMLEREEERYAAAQHAK